MQPLGYIIENSEISPVAVIETRSVHQDDIAVIYRVSTLVGAHFLSARV
jgi:hypothetical protein